MKCTTKSLLRLAFTMCFCVIFTFSAFALSDEDFEFSGGTITKYLGDEKIVVIPETIGGEEVTHIGKDAFRNSDITSVTVPKTVTWIETEAFYSCKSLSEVVLPEGVTKIGRHSFAYCESLSEISLPETLTYIDVGAFGYCTSLKSIKIPTFVQRCERGAFWHCTSLTEIDLSGSVHVWEAMFLGCTALEYVKLPESIKYIGSEAFAGCTSLSDILLPEGLVSIGLYAFGNCASLEKIKIPDGVKELESSTFNGCTSLTEVYLPEGLESIENSVFNGCSLLESITVYPGVTAVGSSAFENCAWSFKIIGTPKSYIQSFAHENLIPFESINGDEPEEIKNGLITNGCVWYVYEDGTLKTTNVSKGKIPDYDRASDVPWYKYAELITKVELGGGVAYVGSNAFGSYPRLKYVNITADVEEIHPLAFGYTKTVAEFTVDENNGYFTAEGATLYSKDKTRLIKHGSPEEINLESGLVEIGDYAFAYSNVKSLKIPDTVKKIGDYAFAYSNVKSLEIPDTVKKIGERAFLKNTFREIDIPNGVEEMGIGCFEDCKQLTYLVIPSSVDIIPENFILGCYELKYIKLARSTEFASTYCLGNSGLEIIYGYSGSPTEDYAANKSAVFVPIDKSMIFPDGGTVRRIFNDGRSYFLYTEGNLKKIYIDDEFYITGISAGTTVEDLDDIIQKPSSTTVKVYDAEGNRIKSGRLASGYEIVLTKSSKELERIPLLVDGDLNGDGYADFADINMYMSAVRGGEIPPYIFACDVTGDGEFEDDDVVVMLKNCIGE